MNNGFSLIFVVLVISLFIGVSSVGLLDLRHVINTCESIFVQARINSEDSIYQIYDADSALPKDIAVEERVVQSVDDDDFDDEYITLEEPDFQLVNVSGVLRRRCRSWRPCYKACSSAVRDTCYERFCHSELKRKLYKQCKRSCRENFV